MKRPTLKEVGRALLAAATSTEAVKREKSLAVLIVTRAILAVGAGDGLVTLVKTLAS